MLRLSTTLCLLLAFTAALFAKEPPQRPISQAVLDAKTVYINNQSGNDKLLSRAANDFKSWGRFTVTDDPAKADMTFIISFESKGHNEENDPLGAVTTQILVPHDDIPQFSYTRQDAVEFMERDITSAIKTLRSRIEASGKK